MKPPKRNPKRLGCLVHGIGGTTLYCNHAMLEDIVAYLRWMMLSNANEHYECHLLWHIGGARQKAHKRLFSLREPELRKRGPKLSPTADITFMLVTNRELAEFRKFEKRGFLPKGWRDGIVNLTPRQ
jgi:hypothetical protein